VEPFEQFVQGRIGRSLSGRGEPI